MTHAATSDAEPDERLVGLVEIWHRACAEFVVWHASSRATKLGSPDQPRRVVRQGQRRAHCPSRGSLAGAPEETLEVAEAPHLKSLMSYYTEQGVLARRDRDLESVVAELEQAVATRYAALCAEPPSDPRAAPPKTPGDVPWDFQMLLSNRPVDVWMHEQDVDGPPTAQAASTPPSPTTCSAHLSAAPSRWWWASAWPLRSVRRCGSRCPRRGSAGPSASATTAGLLHPDEDTEATTTVALTPDDFVVLAGRPPPTGHDTAAHHGRRGDRASPGRVAGGHSVSPAADWTPTTSPT